MRSEILIVTFVSISLTWARTPYSLSLAVGPTTTPSYPEDVENLTDNDETGGKQARIYSMDVLTRIRLRYATTRVSTRVANPFSNATEAVFHLLLPDTAFISNFLMEIGGETYRACVKEKEEAQSEYDQAVSSGQTAAHVSSSARDANQFTVSVNIEANAKVTFNLTYEQLLSRRRGLYEHTVHVNPGTVVPRLSIRTIILETLPISDIRVLPFANASGYEFSKSIWSNECLWVGQVFFAT